MKGAGYRLHADHTRVVVGWTVGGVQPYFSPNVFMLAVSDFQCNFLESFNSTKNRFQGSSELPGKRGLSKLMFNSLFWSIYKRVKEISDFQGRSKIPRLRTIVHWNIQQYHVYGEGTMPNFILLLPRDLYSYHRDSDTSLEGPNLANQNRRKLKVFYQKLEGSISLFYCYFVRY